MLVGIVLFESSLPLQEFSIEGCSSFSVLDTRYARIMLNHLKLSYQRISYQLHLTTPSFQITVNVNDFNLKIYIRNCFTIFDSVVTKYNSCILLFFTSLVVYHRDFNEHYFIPLNYVVI